MDPLFSQWVVDEVGHFLGTADLGIRHFSGPQTEERV